jgi:hypothetical protein
MATDERWSFGHALNVENPNVGVFSRSTLYAKLTLGPLNENWLLASIPGPNATQGWKVSSVKIRYVIKANNPEGGSGGVIDKVGLRDGEVLLHEFLNLTAGPIDAWQTLSLPLPSPSSFKFGLGVSIHANFPGFDLPPNGRVDFLVVGVGLGFVQ